MEKLSGDFEDAMSRKEKVMKALRKVGSGSSDFLMLCVQLDNLDQHFVEIQRAIEAGIKENVARERQLEERLRRVVQEDKTSNFCQEEIRRIKECLAESVRLGSLQDSVMRKEEELGILEKKLKECEDVLVGSRGDLDDCLSTLKDRKMELESVNQLLFECCQQYDLKCLEIEKKVAELEDMKRQHEVFQDSINEQLAAFDGRKNEFELLESSGKRIKGELEAKERELKNATERLEELEKTIQSKNEKLVSVQGSIVGLSESLKSKKEECSIICSKIDKCYSELSEKGKDLRWKDKKVASLEKAIRECLDDLEHKNNQLNFVNESLSRSTKEVEHKERELKKIRQESMEHRVELEKREKRLNILLSSWDEKCKLLEMNEKNFKAKVREFDYWQQQLQPREKSREYSREARLVPYSEEANHWEQAQDKLSENLPCGVSLVSSTIASHGFNSSDDEFVIWKKSGRDPSKEVLDILEESFEQFRSCTDAALCDNISRRHVYLLERMMESANWIEVADGIKERALKMAREWELKLRDKAGGQLEVVGFLCLLSAYKLVPYFDWHGINELAETFSLNETHPGLCQAIGLWGTKTVTPKRSTCSSFPRFLRPRQHKRPQSATSGRWPQKQRRGGSF